jgi:hypothetical protein
MAGCPGCLLSEKEKEEQLKKIYKDAKSYAVQKGVLVVIYQMADHQFAFMEEKACKAAGIYPIKFVSPLLPIKNG